MYTFIYLVFWNKEVSHAHQYPQALSEKIVLEYRQRRANRVLVNDYEPCEATIQHWDEAASDTRLDDSEADELKRLRKENNQLREDKLTLEEAAVWFATNCNER